MTKRESAQKIIKQKHCTGVTCAECPIASGDTHACNAFPRGRNKMLKMTKEWVVKDDARIANELALSTLVRSIPLSSFLWLGKNVCSGRYQLDTPNVCNTDKITWESLDTPNEHRFSKELYGVSWGREDSSDSLFLGLSGHAGYDPQHTIWWNMLKADAEIRRNEMRKRLYEFTMVSKGNGMSRDKIVKTAKEYPSACEKCGDTIHEGTYSLTVQETSTNINGKVYISYAHKLCGYCTASVIRQNAVEASDEANSKEKAWKEYTQGLADWVKKNNVKIGTPICIKDRAEITKITDSKCYCASEALYANGLHGFVRELGINYVVVSIDMFNGTRIVQYKILTVVDEAQEQRKLELEKACQAYAKLDRLVLELEKSSQAYTELVREHRKYAQGLANWDYTTK